MIGDDMAFERDVMIGGQMRSRHEVTVVEHLSAASRRGELTVVHVSSDGFTTRWERELDDSMGFADAEEWVKSLPAFEAYKSPSDALMEEVASMLTDEQAATVPNAYPIWEAGASYQAGQRVRSGGVLYKVLQAHESQEGWEPPNAPSLFAKVLSGQGEVPEWEQPDSTNAYMAGDRVMFEGKVYESLIDNNVWSPADYPQGWEEVSDD